MPTLRLDDARQPARQALLGWPLPESKSYPVTLGADAESSTHIHLATGAPVAATIHESTISTQIALVLTGAGVKVNEAPLAAVRVLRHGDRLQIGGAALTYLDFAPYELAADSSLVGQACAAACPDKLAAGDAVIHDPWAVAGSPALYHDYCWLGLQQVTVSPDRYPVRRLLLSRLAGRIKVERAKEQEKWRCGIENCPHNQGQIAPGEDVIVCPQKGCDRRFHIGCWLPLLECPCHFNIRSVVNEAVFFPAQAGRGAAVIGAQPPEPAHALEPKSPDQDRYARQRLITWWDQERLARARVMVVGAGALGNEVIKNLALLGVGRLLIVDYDRVEVSNLSRSVLLRAGDAGRLKAKAAARRAGDLNPVLSARACWGDVTGDVGLGVFRRMDVVIACLDNRAARLAVNRACWGLGVPWVDGGLDALSGVVSVFLPPHGACYECSMTRDDWLDSDERRPCLRLDAASEPRTAPAVITAAALIAAVQVQEALTILHRQPPPAGSAFYYDAAGRRGTPVLLARRSDCLAHEAYTPLVELAAGAASATLAGVLQAGAACLGAECWIELRRPLVRSWQCPECGASEPVMKLARRGQPVPPCPACGALRVAQLSYTVQASDPGLDLSLEQLGFPALDILRLRTGQDSVFLELSGDGPGHFAWLEDDHDPR